MTKDEDLFVSKLKPYHIILISCLLCTVMILNSNYVNEQRAKERLNKEMSETYNEMMSLRRLEGNSKSDKVCSKGSDDLIEYYKTGDLSLIDLEEGAIKCEDKDASYMKALRGLARKLLGDDDESSENTLRNLDEGDSIKDNLMQYLNRILPMAVFLVIGILSIFGWIGCCICNCCDCCCCCCCKKRTCKIPCFIFTYVYYALVVAISVYGLAESNKIFEGLANTECSFLKFLDQVVNGEIKQSLPRWAGIDGINTILDGIRSEIRSMDKTTFNSNLGSLKSQKTTKQAAFEPVIRSAGNSLFDTGNPPTYKSQYMIGDYNGYPPILSDSNIEVDGYYVLDIIKDFGKYDGSAFTPDGSTLHLWYTEYSTVTSLSEGYIGRASDAFNNILGTGLTPISNALEDAKGVLNDLKGPFDDVNSEIGGTLSDYSDKIDDYGKLAVKIVFSALMVMNIALAVLMALIGLFSMKACVDCCCCRCICKSCVHILWNVLALMMILSFLVGSILALVGRIGGDLMSLASFIFSEDNFNNNQNPLFLDKMGADAKKYLRRCMLGDGNLAAELNIDNSIGDFNALSSVENSISNALIEFSTITGNDNTYNTVKRKVESMGDMSSNFYLKSVDGQESPLSFDKIISSLNKKLEIEYGNNKDQYSRTGTNNDCPTNAGQGKLGLKIKECNLNNLYGSITNNDIDKYTKMIVDTLRLVNHATGTSADSFITILNGINTKYTPYISSYEEILEFLQGEIRRITRFINDYIREGESFSFLNGHFIQINLKILLKYLKHSLGKDLYTVGVCLIVVGCSLILSISSTILLIVIINIGLKEDMEAKNKQVIVSEFQTNNNMKNMPPY